MAADPIPDDVGMSLDDLSPDDFWEGLFGTDPNLSFDLGSDFVVHKSTLKIKAIPEMGVRGQYRDGEELEFVIRVKVEGVHFKPVVTKGGGRIGTERFHHAIVLSCDPPSERDPDEAAETT